MKSEFEMNGNTYIVAGHPFVIRTGEDSLLREELQFNYGPFTARTDPAEDVLFDLEVGLDGCWNDRGGRDLEPVYVAKSDPSEPVLNLYRDGKGWLVEMSPSGSMPAVAVLRTDESFGTGRVSYGDRRFGRFAIDNSAMLLFAFRTAVKGTLEMHSSVVEKDGRAYMFLAASGTGKSTHSRMWLENIEGTTLLNDDNPIVRVMDDGSVRVFGSPWSGKTPCYRNSEAELGAMVLIRRSPENRITEMSVPEAYACVSSSTSGFRPIEYMADGLHGTISSIVLSKTCFVLDCRPDAEAAEICFRGVCGK